MTVEQLSKEIGKLLTNGGQSRKIENGFTCDLLSWVMTKGKSGMGWITVQTHLNVIAVATLLDMAVIIIPESIKVEQASIDKANEEGIAIISSALSTYEICAIMSANGIPAPANT